MPIAVDPRLFEPRTEDDEPTTMNTLVFSLDVQCAWKGEGKAAKKKKKGGKGSDDERGTVIAPDGREYVHGVVYSSDIKWRPRGDQAARFDGEKLPRPRPVHDDVGFVRIDS